MNSVPLTDVLPWGDTIPNQGRTILICDSAETDGRFLLYTMASQCLTSSSNNNSLLNQTSTLNHPRSNISNGKVLWIHCGCSTDDQIRMALKKASSSENISNSSSSTVMRAITSSSTSTSAAGTKGGPMPPLQIMNVMHQLSEYYLTNEGGENLVENIEIFVKQMYVKVRNWMKNQQQSNDNNNGANHPLIIIDNASLLSNQIGSKLTHVLIQKIQNMILHNKVRSPPNETTLSENENEYISTKSTKAIGCLAILCSNDFDQEYYLNSTQQSKRNTNVTGGKIIQFIGGGGRGILCDSEEMAVLNQRMMYELEHIWERSLVETADGIIDVMPLASGFARDVHGRLVFTERPGSSLGWKDCGSNGSSRNVRNQQSRSVMSMTGSNRRNFRAGSGSSDPSQSKFSTTTVNYCCSDGGVRAIRLQV